MGECSSCREGQLVSCPHQTFRVAFAPQHHSPVELCIRLLSVRNLEGRGGTSNGRVRSGFVKQYDTALTGEVIRAGVCFPNGGAIRG